MSDFSTLPWHIGSRFQNKDGKPGTVTDILGGSDGSRLLVLQLDAGGRMCYAIRKENIVDGVIMSISPHGQDILRERVGLADISVGDTIIRFAKAPKVEVEEPAGIVAGRWHVWKNQKMAYVLHIEGDVANVLFDETGNGTPVNVAELSLVTRGKKIASFSSVVIDGVKYESIRDADSPLVGDIKFDDDKQ